MARRFGSAMISNTDSMLSVYAIKHIRVKAYLMVAEKGTLQCQRKKIRLTHTHMGMYGCNHATRAATTSRCLQCCVARTAADAADILNYLALQGAPGGGDRGELGPGAAVRSRSIFACCGRCWPRPCAPRGTADAVSHKRGRDSAAPRVGAHLRTFLEESVATRQRKRRGKGWQSPARRKFKEES